MKTAAELLQFLCSHDMSIDGSPDGEITAYFPEECGVPISDIAEVADLLHAFDPTGSVTVNSDSGITVRSKPHKDVAKTPQQRWQYTGPGDLISGCDRMRDGSCYLIKVGAVQKCAGRIDGICPFDRVSGKPLLEWSAWFRLVKEGSE